MNLVKLIFCLMAIFSAASSFAASEEILTFDTKETRNDGLPRNFRDLSGIGINAIASGEFSEEELQAVRKKYPHEKIIIVDLRRESHGFINGQSVNWKKKFDLSNMDKKSSEIIFDENLRLVKAQKNKKIVVNKIIEKDKKTGWYKKIQPETITINSTSTEKKLAEKYGFGYKRFSVRDHAKPDDKELNNIITFLRHLDPSQKIYVHCAAGKGRTTTFLTIFDIIKNGKEVSLQTILQRQNSLGGAKLADTSEKEEWRTKLAKERLEMIRQFYSKETGKTAD